MNISPKIILYATVACLSIWLSIMITFAQETSNQVYLPLVSNNVSSDSMQSAVTPQNTPTLTATPQATTTATPTSPVAPLPDPTFDNCQGIPDPATAPNYPVRIVDVLKSESPEIVQLRNESDEIIDLTDWRMCSVLANQEHTGIMGTIAPGEIKDFVYTGSGFIWNNNEKDDGALYNAEGQLVSYWVDE